MHKFLLSLGSNLGERLKYISEAIFSLAKRGEVLSVSDIYECEPIEMPEGNGLFLNCAIHYRTYLDPRQLLSYIHLIENSFGRETGLEGEPRPIDIDIIEWSGGEWQTADLTIPHPRAARRRFVVVPVNQLVPGSYDEAPVAKQTVERFCGPDILFTTRNA
jgi:2-amino-4-hydroxy-6-hydroxymethyldihydropteridine diphosphokinase